ncbi:MAG: sodium/proline symporter, partial [Clostridia bacterium]|nr:sodium/proline symporter [Clostridia bacterium]
MNAERIAFLLYFVLVLGIGLYFFRKGRKDGADEEQYFLGGRKMGPWVTAMSAQALDMSAWLLMGLPGTILAFGLGQAWIGIGVVIGTVLNWVFIAKRLRKFSRAAGDAITFPEYLSNRFLTDSPALSVLTAVVILVAFTVYVASGFVAGASVFTTLVPSVSENTALLLFAAVILLYTFLGGFKAVCWTDFFQGLLMLVALVSVPVLVYSKGHLDPAALDVVYTNAQDGTRYVFTRSLFDATWQEVASGLAWGLGYCGMPHILVRFMSIEKPSMIRKSATVAILWVILSLVCCISIAYLGRMILAGELLPAGDQKLV